MALLACAETAVEHALLHVHGRARTCEYTPHLSKTASAIATISCGAFESSSQRR